jgi:stage II sporulation protein D
MSRRLCLAAVTALTAAACFAPPDPDTPRAPMMAAPDVVRVGTSRGVVEVPLEDYVLGTVLAEVSPVGETPDTVARIFDVQAIIARTYTLAHLGRHRAEGFDVCDRTHCQLYDPQRIRSSRFADAARRAVDRTRGVVLSVGGRPIDALYHSDCGGHTASAEDVWGSAVSYLVGEPDDVPSLVHHTWTFETTSARLRAAFNADSRTSVGRRLDAIAVSTRDRGGRAAALELRGGEMRVVRGEQLRAVLNRTFGDRAIQSTRFTVRRNGAAYRFEGSGFGHGVGLCQTGAAARARRGDSPGTILMTYFPGATAAAVRSPAAMRHANPVETFASR